MGLAALNQDEVDNLMEKETVKLKSYILSEIKFFQHDNEIDEYYIKGIASLIMAKNCKKRRKKKAAN